MPTTTRSATLSGCLTLEEVLPLAQRIAHRHARRRDEEDDLVQVALFAYHRTITALKDPKRASAGRCAIDGRINTTIGNPRSFACRVLRCAMLNYYTPAAQFHADHDDIDDYAVPSRESQLDLLEQDDFYDNLERECGKTARAVVENLVAPSGACSRAILANVQAKLKRCGEMKHTDPRRRPRGVIGSVRVSQESVRRAMGLTPSEWALCLQRVRAFALIWFGRTAATPS